MNKLRSLRDHVLLWLQSYVINLILQANIEDSPGDNPEALQVTKGEPSKVNVVWGAGRCLYV